METSRRKALGRGLEELFNNEPMDYEKIEEIFKSEPHNIVQFYINYIRNVDTYFYKDMQKYVCTQTG